MQQYFSVDRPLVVLQSDDWGRVGIRDAEGQELLRGNGINLEDHPYDFYSLETSDDVASLHEVLLKHRDSAGRTACMVMNFLLANLDFVRMASEDFKNIHLMPLTEGLPGHWVRPGLFDEYRKGIAAGVFFPALHGLTHFCSSAVERNLARNPERALLLRKLWAAETPYIYWRMPWISYEYCDPEKPYGFLDKEKQQELIKKAAAIFREFFGIEPVSACAPGYRANADTHKVWAEQGVRVAQNGSGDTLPPHMDEHGLLHLYRTIDLEPCKEGFPLEKYVALASDCIARKVPIVISVHSINFHSTLKNFRERTLHTLDELLTVLEAKHPNLLYVNDFELHKIVTQGKLLSPHGWVPVDVKQSDARRERFAAMGAD